MGSLLCFYQIKEIIKNQATFYTVDLRGKLAVIGKILIFHCLWSQVAAARLPTAAQSET